MAVVTVTHADQSKSGKQRIFIGGKNNWQDGIYVGQRCASVPPVGATIDANMSSKTFPDGRQMWFLNSWAAVDGRQNGAVNSPQSAANNPAGSIPAPGGAQGDATGSSTGALRVAPAPTIKGWPDLPTGDMLRWVSNVVGSAIAAQLIRTPSDIAQWVGASYRAAESLRSGDVPEFDSDVPRFTEPDPADRQGFEEGDPGFDNSQDPF
jgi:hypothetical protein